MTSSAGFTQWAAWARAHGPPQEKRPPQRDKRPKKCMLQKVKTFTSPPYNLSQHFFGLIGIPTSLKHGSRGECRGARPSREKSAYTTLLVFILGQFFGQIPQIFAARFARRRGTFPAFFYYYYKCPHSLLYVLRYVGRQGLHINCAHGPPQG